MFDIFKKLINRAGKKMVEMTAETILAADTKAWLENTLTQWIGSKERKEQLDAERYYLGDHDILKRKRTALDGSGRRIEVENLINNKLVDNLYRSMVDQKQNFSFGKPFLVESENEQAAEAVREIFNDDFMQLLTTVAQDAQNGGRAALYPYYNEDGEFCFEIFKGSELLPIWKDSRHTKLLFCLRYYVTEKQKVFGTETVEKVQLFTKDCCYNFIRSGGRLIPDTDAGDVTYYMTVDRVVDAAENKVEKLVYGWERVPLVFFRFSEEEKPLLNRCRSLQDGYNEIISNYKNILDEDPGQTIMVLKNLGGTKLSEFRENLAQYRAVKVQNVNGVEGGVDTLSVEINTENYEFILKLLKKQIVENCKGFDVKDDTVGGNANQMHITAMYNDIGLEAEKFEGFFRVALQQLLFFVTAHLANTGKGDFTAERFEISFERNIIQDWHADMATINSMFANFPAEYVYSITPGVKDPKALVEMKDAENKKAMEEFAMPMPSNDEHNANGGNNDDE